MSSVQGVSTGSIQPPPPPPPPPRAAEASESAVKEASEQFQGKQLGKGAGIDVSG